MSILTSRTHNAGKLWAVQSHSPAAVECEQDCQQLSISVVFTTTGATLAALKHARELAHGLSAQIRILVPQVVPYALPLDRPPIDPAFRVRPFCAAAEKESIDMRIEVRLCRDRRIAIAEALRPRSLVLMGGRNRWWPTRESSFARGLRRAGHHVIIVTEK